MLKKILIASCFSFLLLNASSFEFNHSSSNSYKGTNSDTSEAGREKEVIVTGYGINEHKALGNAFKTAVEQYIGIVVDSESIMKNGKLIEDNILTASIGFLKTYKKISVEKNDDGLVAVKIKAIVKSQKVLKKIKSLNIHTISIKNSKNIYARVITKQNSKKDSAKILKKVVGNFLSPKSLSEMITIKIENTKVLEDEVDSQNRIPINISYSLELNYKIYLQKIRKLEQVFKNLGATLRRRVDLPYISERSLNPSSNKVLNKLLSTDIGIIKKYGDKYKLDVFKFPKSWNDIFPFNITREDSSKKVPPAFYPMYWNNMFQIILEINGNDEVLFADRIIPSDVTYLNILLRGYRGYSYEPFYGAKHPKIIVPMFGNNKSKLVFSTSVMINIEKIDDITDMTIELEEI